jgi:hypothetical protein
MSDIVEFIEARLAEHEALADAATQGKWEWSGTDLVVFEEEWRKCQYWCAFEPDSTASRGTPSTPGHEHRFADELVVTAIGYDNPEVQVGDQDKAHIAGQPTAVRVRLGRGAAAHPRAARGDPVRCDALRLMSCRRPVRGAERAGGDLEVAPRLPSGVAFRNAVNSASSEMCPELAEYRIAGETGLSTPR